MKTIIAFLMLISLIHCEQKNESIALTEAKEFQYEMNIEFSDLESSPLTKADFQSFKSLDFFPINEQLRIEANFTKTPNEEPFKILTTTSRLATYVKYGIANFTLENKKLKLNIYQNTDGEKHLFLPYFDRTNGNESYAGGRYINIDKEEGNTIIIDFNKSYNPYCAYNHKYSCPIPPKENTLAVKINAGVKKFISSNQHLN